MNENASPEQDLLAATHPCAALPGETPEAYEAFIHYLELKERRLETVAEERDVNLSTVKAWSSKFRWRQRIVDYHARLMGTRAQAEEAVRQRQALARAELDLQDTRERAVRVQHLRQRFDYIFDDYVQHNLEKTTLQGISGFLMTVERLASALSSADPSPARSTAQYDADLRKVYGIHTPERGLQAASISEGPAPTTPTPSPDELPTDLQKVRGIHTPERGLQAASISQGQGLTTIEQPTTKN